MRVLLHVSPGLEEVAGTEVARRFPGAERVGVWRQFDERTSLLEYRVQGDGRDWLALETVEDIFLLAARARALTADERGLAELSAAILTSKYLDPALRAFAPVGQRPRTFRIVARKAGVHAYRRVDAQRAVERALRTRLPALRLVPDDADAEFWLTIVRDVALLGLRLSDRHMRGRAAPFQSLPAALKPTVARAMAHLSVPRPDDRVLDPMCGAGTLLLERARIAPYGSLLGGDRDRHAVAAARANARAAGVRLDIRAWDALDLPVDAASIDCILTNPPFGKQMAIAGDVDQFYTRLLRELRRVLRPGGRLVLITSQDAAVRQAMRTLAPSFGTRQRIPLLLRGERAVIFVLTA